MGYVGGIVVTGLLAVLSIVFAVVIFYVPYVRQWVLDHLPMKGNVPLTSLLFAHRDKVGGNFCYTTGIGVPALFKSLQRLWFHGYIYHITITCMNDALRG